MSRASSKSFVLLGVIAASALGISFCSVPGEVVTGTTGGNEGTIRIVTTTTGNSTTTQYAISIDGVPSGTMGINATRTFRSVRTGARNVAIGGVASSDPQQSRITLSAEQ